MIKKLILILTLSILVVSCTNNNNNNNNNSNNNLEGKDDTSNRSEQEEIAINFTKDFIYGNVDSIKADYTFDDNMSNNFINNGSLESFIEQMPNQFGEFIKIHEDTIETSVMQGKHIVMFQAEYTDQNIKYSVTLDADKTITSFLLVPEEDNSITFLDNDVLKEIETNYINEYTLEDGQKVMFDINGTLTLPKNIEKPPVVILVHGSGPNNRDEQLSENIAVFKDIAHGLAEKGIATYRYDKRSLTNPETNNTNVDLLVLSDVNVIINNLSQSEDINTDNIFILGHSLGGMLIPSIAQENDSIAGYIMLAAPARKVFSVILPEQFDYIRSTGFLTDEQYTQQSDFIKNMIDDVDNKISGSAFIREVDNIDMVTLAKDINVPVAVMQGDRDYQVTIKDYNIWNENFKNNDLWTFYLYSNLNHSMIHGDEPSTPNDYNIGGNVDNLVINDMTNWINNNLK